MNEQKKVTLPGSVSNVPTTNYARAYGIACTWASQYTVEEFKRLLIGRGIDITDIDVVALHAAGVSSGLDAVKPGESAMSSKSMMQPQTPEQQEAAWASRKEEVLKRKPMLADHVGVGTQYRKLMEHQLKAAENLLNALRIRHCDNPEKLARVEALSVSMLSDERSFVQASRDLTEAMSLADVYSANEDPAWAVYKQELTFGTEGNHAPIKYTGESEFSRIGDYNGATDFKSGSDIVNRLLNTGYHLDEVKLADLGVGKLLDADGLKAILPPDFKVEDGAVSYRGMSRPLTMHSTCMEVGDIFGIPKLNPMGRGELSVYGRTFRHYTPEYLREQAIARKAKRIKNQRRRRNAKARRK